MPKRIDLAMHPPRFMRGGIRLHRRRPRSDDLASLYYDEQQRIDAARNESRNLEREGR
jgi:hypothetical protein